MSEEYWVYVLRSRSSGRLYTGSTNNLERRLGEHNQRHTASTRGKGPWEIVYREKVGDRAEARARERFLKSGRGREFLKGALGENG